MTKGFLRLLRVAMLSCASLFAAFGGAHAHDQAYAVAQARVGEDRRVEIALSFHVAAFLIGAPQAHLDDAAMQRFSAMSDEDLEARIDTASAYLRENMALIADQQPQPIAEVRFPDLATLRADGLVPAEFARPSAPVILTAQLPPGTVALSIAPPPDFSQTLVSLQTPGGATVAQVVPQYAASQPMVLDPAGSSVLVAVPSWLVTIAQYLALGFTHILPGGADHLLFVAGLFLFSPRWQALAWQVTAFTLAHSVTLALAALDLAPAPAGVVEPLIAASIALIALDNLRPARADGARDWRLLVVFAFGLLHGLGFAGALARLGLPPGQEAVALVSFNVGVEAGQIAALLALFALLGWTGNKPWRRRLIVIPCSGLIGAFGIAWMVERIVAQF